MDNSILNDCLYRCGEINRLDAVLPDSPIDILPPELLQKILIYVDDLELSSSICHKWAKIEESIYYILDRRIRRVFKDVVELPENDEEQSSIISVKESLVKITKAYKYWIPEYELNLENCSFPKVFEELEKKASIVFVRRNKALVRLGEVLDKKYGSIDKEKDLVKDMKYWENEILLHAKELKGTLSLTGEFKDISECIPLSPYIGAFSGIKELHLSLNKLKSLPESIGNLNALTTLRLNNNKLSTLPESIGQLENLEILLLSGNELSTLPESMKNLNKLKKLFISSNHFTELPTCVYELITLEVLKLSGCKVNVLTSDIQNLTRLKTLDISDNKLSALPKEIEDLPALCVFNP